MFFPFVKKKSVGRIYLDHAAATPVRPEVVDVMQPYFTEYFGNASAIHAEGLRAKTAVEAARVEVGRALRARPSEIYFTGSGSESNNAAISGLIEQLHGEQSMAYADMEIITTKLEHPSVLRVVEAWARRGVQVTYVPVDSTGMVTSTALRDVLSAKTVLVTTAYINSEIGTVQPVKALSRVIAKFNQEYHTRITFHLDASQAPYWVSCNIESLGIDMMTLDAGKCGGPKGIGVLFVDKQIALVPIIHGGGQERGLRAGTENTPLLVGAGKAIAMAQADYEACAAAMQPLRDRFIKMLQTTISTCVLNGPVGSDRVANNVNISLPGFDTEYAVVALDAAGIAASTKSACSGAGSGRSEVVWEISHDVDRADSTIRFSLGPASTSSDVDRTVSALAEHVTQMRNWTNH